jgi:hypothetical protein
VLLYLRDRFRRRVLYIRGSGRIGGENVARQSRPAPPLIDHFVDFRKDQHEHTQVLMSQPSISMSRIFRPRRLESPSKSLPIIDGLNESDAASPHCAARRSASLTA